MERSKLPRLVACGFVAMAFSVLVVGLFNSLEYQERSLVAPTLLTESIEDMIFSLGGGTIGSLIFAVYIMNVRGCRREAGIVNGLSLFFWAGTGTVWTLGILAYGPWHTFESMGYDYSDPTIFSLGVWYLFVSTPYGIACGITIIWAFYEGLLRFVGRPVLYPNGFIQLSYDALRGKIWTCAALGITSIVFQLLVSACTA